MANKSENYGSLYEGRIPTDLPEEWEPRGSTGLGLLERGERWWTRGDEGTRGGISDFAK